MDEYIEKSKAYEVLSDYYHHRTQGQHEALREAFNRVPTVDAVPVVRCRKCAHCIVNESHPDRPLICCLTKKVGTTDPDWFCADGERREECGE